MPKCAECSTKTRSYKFTSGSRTFCSHACKDAYKAAIAEENHKLRTGRLNMIAFQGGY